MPIYGHFSAGDFDRKVDQTDLVFVCDEGCVCKITSLCVY